MTVLKYLDMLLVLPRQEHVSHPGRSNCVYFAQQRAVRELLAENRLLWVGRLAYHLEPAVQALVRLRGEVIVQNIPAVGRRLGQGRQGITCGFWGDVELQQSRLENLQCVF